MVLPYSVSHIADVIRNVDVKSKWNPEIEDIRTIEDHEYDCNFEGILL